MAALASPVELPTSRNSFIHVGTGSDINNPGWIPVLRKGESQYDASQEKELSPYTGASFSPMPPYTVDPPQQTPKPSSIHSYSRSSVAPEMVELEAASLPPPVPLLPPPPIPHKTSRHMNFELPATRPTSRYFEKVHITSLSGDATLASTDTETNGDISRSDSNAGTSVTTDDQASVQAPTTVKDETLVQAPPAVKEETPSFYQGSKRSSYASTKKYSIGPPTSKFNRKPAPAFPSRTTSLQPEANPLSTALSSTNSPIQSRNLTPAQSPRLTTIPPEYLNLEQSPPTVSKKAPSLRPTPSNASLSSKSSSAETAPAAVPPPTLETQRPDRGPRKSPASVEAQQANSNMKPPTLPLPPAIAMEQERTDGLIQEQGPMSVIEKAETARMEKPERAKLASEPRAGPSAGVSSFMTAKDTVIFRRFDEVHVQLLLCLQDEITQLERELMRLESAILTRTDRDIERSRVIRELRKVVAEYDHLFSSWSQMQASQASKATQQSLRTWLERRATSAEAAVTSQNELNWLDESKDLSSVSLRQASDKRGGGSVSSFMGGICGKRK